MISSNKVLLESRKVRLFDIALLCVNLLFILLLLMFGYFNRLAADDFAYYFRVRDMGVWDAFIFAYKTWNTRWASILFMNIMMKLFNPESSLLLYYAFLLGLFIFSVYQMMKSLFSFLIIETSSFLCLNFTLLFISGFFMLTFGIDETWLWMNASTIYIFPVAMFCLGFSFLLSPKNDYFTHLMLNISFLFAGGGNEPFAVLIILSLISLFISLAKEDGFVVINHFDSRFFNKIGASILILFTSFLINYFCPGVAVRQGFLPPANTYHILGSIGVTLLHLSKIILLEKLMFIIPFAMLWMILGSVFVQKNYELKFNLKTVFKYVVGSTVAIALFTVVISSILLHGRPPLRTLTVISFFMTIGFAVIGFCVGYHYFNQKYFKAIIYSSAIALMISYNTIIILQYPIMKAHALAYDQRISALKTLESVHTAPFQKVAPLPPSGWLYAGDISSDTSNIQNFYLKKSLLLNFNIMSDSSKANP